MNDGSQALLQRISGSVARLNEVLKEINVQIEVGLAAKRVYRRELIMRCSPAEKRRVPRGPGLHVPGVEGLREPRAVALLDRGRRDSRGAKAGQVDAACRSPFKKVLCVGNSVYISIGVQSVEENGANGLTPLRDPHGTPPPGSPPSRRRSTR